MVIFARFPAYTEQKIFSNCLFYMLLYNLYYETKQQKNYIRPMPRCPDGITDWQ